MLQGNDLTLPPSSWVTLSKSPDLSEPLCKRRLRIAVLASTYQMLPGTQQYFKCIPGSKSVLPTTLRGSYSQQCFPDEEPKAWRELL